MGEIPKFENKESAEQRLVRLLKKGGIEDPEARELLDSWTQEQEAQVENSPAASIELNFRRARLYFAAGYLDESYENFEAAREQAWNDNNPELYQKIVAEMDEIESQIMPP